MRPPLTTRIAPFIPKKTRHGCSNHYPKTAFDGCRVDIGRSGYGNPKEAECCDVLLPPGLVAIQAVGKIAARQLLVVAGGGRGSSPGCLFYGM
jgi:hypothetical protein